MSWLSTYISAPVDQLEAVNAAIAELGHGEGTLSVPMRGATRVEDPQDATHYCCHGYFKLDEIEAIAEALKPFEGITFKVHNSGLSEERLEELRIEPADKESFDLVDGEAGEYFYVPVDPRLIEGLSRGLYALTNVDKIEGLYAPIIQHPDLRQWPILQLREKDIVPIGLKSDPAPLQQVLAVFVQDGAMQQSDLDGIVSGVQQAAGGSVRVRDFIPESWERYVMTREQAEQAGYF